MPRLLRGRGVLLDERRAGRLLTRARVSWLLRELARRVRALAVWVEGPQLKVLTLASFMHRARYGGGQRRGTNWWRNALMQDPCVYCGARPDGLDHIQPRSKRGADGWENRAPACRRCDSAKKAQPMMVWWAVNRPDVWRPATTRRTATTTRAERRAIIQQLGLTPPKPRAVAEPVRTPPVPPQRRARLVGDAPRPTDVDLRRVTMHPSIRPN